jgi:hypothetical protein
MAFGYRAIGKAWQPPGFVVGQRSSQFATL